MIFVGVALLIAAGLAVAISADAGTMVGLTQDQTAQAIPLVVILIVVAGAVFSRRRRLSEIVGNMVLWAGIFAVMIVGYTYRYELSGAARRVMSELTPGAAVVSQDGASATFARGFSGSFQLNAKVNDAPTTMIFDTGASAVVLTREDARRAGIDTGNLRFEVPVQTANGTGMAAPIVIDEVQVGNISRRNVRAFVADDGALGMSLLGMTFLETLSRYAVTRDSLELRD